MERNDELIDRVMDYIREHPKEWDQRFWAEKNTCGTTACFAGHAMLLSGYTVVREPRGCDPDFSDDHSCESCCCNTIVTKFVRPDGIKVLPETEPREASKLLGLRQLTAERIFYRTQIVDVDDLQEIIDAIRAED